MNVIANSREICGYTVKVHHRPAFDVAGYTCVCPPGRKGDQMIRDFWTQVRADGRLEKLMACAPHPQWLLGMGSWDVECPPHGTRYTICLEVMPGMDLSSLAGEEGFFRKRIAESDWLDFALSAGQNDGRFWKDNPYKMMGLLGYRFNDASFDVGLHFDAYPPGYDLDTEDAMEFWITVIKE